MKATERRNISSELLTPDDLLARSDRYVPAPMLMLLINQALASNVSASLCYAPASLTDRS